jgi:tRNA1(Val) A37 N6-methylase TrmN6
MKIMQPPGELSARRISSFQVTKQIDVHQQPNGWDTTDDAFLGGQLTIAQTRNGSRAGLDAVFLAAACPVEPGSHVLDLGAGSGIVALATACRVRDTQVTGIELDAELCELARSNAKRNKLSDRARFIVGDVTGPTRKLIEAGLAPDSFDHALANPPFLATGNSRLPSDKRLRLAHALNPGDLEKWIKCLTTFLKPGGTATIIHRADALPQLLEHCKGRLGRISIFPLFPRQGAPASRIILQGRKGSRAPLNLASGMVLHEAGEQFTPEAQAILRGGAGLDVTPDK